MFKGMLPMLIQIPLILGLINVIYNPLQHLLHFDHETVRMLIDHASMLTGVSVPDMGYSAQLTVMQLVQADPTAFAGAGEG
ncbi:MAG TPA: hypothetical protein DEB24_05610, partial [Coriobacteriia bacterium]|nr:hypothetical protein [Coriobacteriia bacterium]